MQEQSSFSDQQVQQMIDQSESLDQIQLNNISNTNNKRISQPQQFGLSGQLEVFFQQIQNNNYQLSKMVKLPKSQKAPRNVCAKILKNGQIIVECYDCRTDSSCVICIQCFKNGSHEGHRYVTRAAGGGCCDCGDIQAWKKEGFCKNHNGKNIDIKIHQKVQLEADGQFQKLFTIYLYLSFKYSHRSQIFSTYAKNLIAFLLKLNTNDNFYNKITTLCFMKPLQLKKVNNQLQYGTILQIILNIKISGSLAKSWIQVFISMFGCYSFKLQLLKCYIQNYGYIVDGSQISTECASSIACQILSSHQLIQKYCQNYTVGIGQNSPVPKLKIKEHIKKFKMYYTRLQYDIIYFTKLSGTASLSYFRMHINSKQCLSNLFGYYDVIAKYFKKCMKNQSMSQIQFMLNVMQLSNVQEQMICNFAKIMRIIKIQKDLIVRVIQFLWNKCIQTTNSQIEKQLLLFRPYQRCFCLAIFTFLQCQLQKVKGLRQQLLINVLKTDQKNFGEVCKKLMVRLLKTYLLYAKTLNEPGLRQSFYVHLAYYKIKYHIVSSTDILSLKLLIALLKQNYVFFNLQQIIQYESDEQAQQSKTKQNRQAYQKQVMKKKLYLVYVLTFLKYLFVFYFSQINIAYQINQQSAIYQKRIQEFLLNLFVEGKGILSIDRAKIVMNRLFTDKVKYVEKWLNQNCIVNKQKKQLQIKQGLTILTNLVGVNYSDIWQNQLSEVTCFVEPHKTRLGVQEYNRQIFNKIWNFQTIQTLVKLVNKLYKNKNEGIQCVIQSLIPICQLKKDEENCIGQAELIKDIGILPFLSDVSLQLRQKLTKLHYVKPSLKNQKATIDEVEQQKLKRKTLIEQKKNKKLQKIKLMQNKVLNNMNQQEQLQLIKSVSKQSSQSFNSIDEQNSEQICCICKNQKSENLVYFVNIQMKNQQRLLNIGPGISCLTFNSCFHTFDYSCVKDRYKQNIPNARIKCPLCKYVGVLLLPVNPQKLTQKVIENVLLRIFAVSLTNFKQNQLGLLNQQIVNSIYHYILLCCIDSKNYFEKRIKLYKILYRMIAYKIDENQFKQLAQKLNKNKKSIFKKQAMKAKLSVISSKNKKNKIQLQQPKLKQGSSSKILNCDTRQSKYNAFLRSQDQINIYQIVINSILRHLKQNSVEIKLKITQDQVLKSKNETIEFIKVCLKTIYDQKIGQNEIQIIKHFNKYQYKQILKGLPLKYQEFVHVKKQCLECHQTQANMIFCLICNWVGCQVCQNGTSQHHSMHKHGAVGVFMFFNSSTAFYQTTSGVSLIGQLYQNNWGHSVYRSSKWEQFQLNRQKVKQIELCLLYDKQLQYLDKNK